MTARVVLVFSPKGGGGKTTVARNLLAAAAADGLAVGGLDTDPQGTLSRWFERRPGGAVTVAATLSSASEVDRLVRALQTVAETLRRAGETS